MLSITMPHAFLEKKCWEGLQRLPFPELANWGAKSHVQPLSSVGHIAVDIDKLEDFT